TDIDRRSVERLAATAPPLPDPWTDEQRRAFVDLLLAGPPAIRVIETLDQRDLWRRVLPEWTAVRARPQRNAYHRFTVDRHLLETAANAARLADRVDRPDLLVIAALLHDIGKGRPGDHTEVGVGLAAGITSRMGYPAADVEVICRLVEHHLLLSEVATRRDLDDPTTVMRVVSSVASASQLQLLAALTEADSLATGSAAWGPWKAELVGRLVERVLHVLEGGELSEVVEASFPTPAALERLARGGRVLEGAGDTLVVMADDRPGMFSRVAGVLALHGLDVMSAAAHSRAGRALSEFHVRGRLRPEIRWERVVADLERALDGRLALQSRLAERSRTYRRRDARGPRPGVHVRVDNHASAEWTVIDVHASDGEGVLYRITRAFAELDLDIRSAKVETQAGTVVDAFYVSDAHGAKITDTDTLAELERAITHSLAE
ncbi:MAG TPA: HD domain-containing protein, partial [Nocardioides sp.]|nr:HD domain-containing protein [Nocardioides sp.]